MKLVSVPTVGENKEQKQRLKAEKKRAKNEAKIAKKRIEAGLPAEPHGRPAPRASRAARFSDFVRGGLYVLLGVSLLVALVLGQRDVVVSLDELIANLFVATAGKIVLAVIGLGLAIYGLRKLGLMR